MQKLCDIPLGNAHIWSSECVCVEFGMILIMHLRIMTLTGRVLGTWGPDLQCNRGKFIFCHSMKIFFSKYTPNDVNIILTCLKHHWEWTLHLSALRQSFYSTLYICLKNVSCNFTGGTRIMSFWSRFYWVMARRFVFLIEILKDFDQKYKSTRHDPIESTSEAHNSCTTGKIAGDVL